MLRLALIWLVSAPFSWLLCPFIMSPSFLEHVLIFWHNKMFRAQLLLFLPQPSFLSVAKIWVLSNINRYQSNRCKVIAPGCLHSHFLLLVSLSLPPMLVVSSSVNCSSRPLPFFHWGCCLFCCLQEFLIYSKHCSLRHCNVFTLNICLLTLSIGSFGQNSFILI